MAFPSRPSVRATRLGLVTTLLAAQVGVSHAAFIDFEELPPIPGNEDLWGYPIGDRYAHLGVHFGDNNSLVHWTPNAYPLVQPGGEFVLRFTGELPTYVSFQAWSATPMSARWRGATGRGSNLELDGGFEQVSFASASGIALVKLTYPSGTRPSFISLDNLYFGNVPAVPEPAPLLLAAAGAGVLGWRARRARKNCSTSVKTTKEPPCT